MAIRKKAQYRLYVANTPKGGVPVATRTLLAYSLPYVPVILLWAPMHIVHGIYAKYLGLPLTAIAGVVVFARIFDAVTDPLIGYFSDRHRAHSGTRKPFIIAGGLICVVGGYFLYSPPNEVSILYLTCAFVVFYTGWTLLEIPYVAWGGELARTSIEKTRVFSYRSAMSYGGLLLFYAVPLLPFFATTDITLETLRWAAIGASSMMVPFLYIAITRVPDGHIAGDTGEQQWRGLRHSIGSWLRLFSDNRPFLILTAAYLTVFIGAYMWYGLIFIYVDAYLGLGALFAQMFMVSFAVGVACTPLWYKLAAWLGRKSAWCLANALMAGSFIYTGLLEPGETTFPELLVLKVMNTLGFVAMGILIPSVLSDTVDYGTWKFGVSRGASYFASYTFGTKAVNALGAALALAIAGWYGFDPTAGTQTARAIFGMYLSVAWIPLAFVLTSFVFVLLIPINGRRHEVIRRRLEEREARWRRGSAATAAAGPSASVPAGYMASNRTPAR